MPKTIFKISGYIGAVILAVWALWFAYDLLTGTAKTKARLGANQTDAAVASGADAVNTTGDQAEGETGRAKKTKDMQNEVDNANDAGGAHAAGAEFLCENFDICAEE